MFRVKLPNLITHKNGSTFIGFFFFYFGLSRGFLWLVADLLLKKGSFLALSDD